MTATIGLGAAAVLVLRPQTAISSERDKATETDPRLGPQLVQITIAKPAQALERAFTGIISARVQSNLGFRVPGKVIERLVDVGQNVRAGQPLMRLDQKDLDLALTAAENAVAAAHALAVQAKADDARYRQLAADGWVARQKYDQVKAAFDSATAQLAAAQARADVARNEAGYSLLIADADGTVVDTLAEPGQVVASEAVHAQIRQRPVFRTEALGEKAMKGIANPIRVYSVTLH